MHWLATLDAQTCLTRLTAQWPTAIPAPSRRGALCRAGTHTIHAQVLTDHAYQIASFAGGVYTEAARNEPLLVHATLFLQAFDPAWTDALTWLNDRIAVLTQRLDRPKPLRSHRLGVAVQVHLRPGLLTVTLHVRRARTH